MTSRYLKIVLTVIAVELFWLGASGLSRPASAQVQGQTPTVPVVITGIRLSPDSAGMLPVTVRGNVSIVTEGALKIEADRPLPVENVPYTPSRKPGG